MDHLQRNGGLAGYVAALLFAVTVIVGFNVPGPGATFDDPGKVLTYVAAHRWLWRLINILGIFLSGFAIVFAIGVWSRLRERAPTRAAASLAFALIGLAGYALANLLLWKGGINMALYAARDQVAASHAWLALAFAARSAIDTGNAFVGAALLIGGWAIIATGALRRPSAGWPSPPACCPW